MYSQNRSYELALRLPGRVVPMEIRYSDAALVQGSPNSPYSIVISNKTTCLLYVVLSIDGHSLIGPEEASKHDEGIIIEPGNHIELAHFLTPLEEKKGFAFKALDPYQRGFISAVFYSAPEESDYMVQGYKNSSGVWVSSFIQRNQKPEDQLTIYYYAPEQVVEKGFLKLPNPLPDLFPKDKTPVSTDK